MNKKILTFHEHSLYYRTLFEATVLFLKGKGTIKYRSPCIAIHVSNFHILVRIRLYIEHFGNEFFMIGKEFF